MKYIHGGKIITPTEVIEGKCLIIKDSKILEIADWNFELEQAARGCENSEIIDAEGAFISPGFIDIHSDYIEQLLSPRPRCLMDFNMALRESEKHLLVSAITTMYHSLSMMGGPDSERKEIRSYENLIKLMDLINQQSDRDHIIHHRFHLRVETDNHHRVGEIMGFIKQGKVDMLSFMDHTPGQGQYTDIAKYRQIIKGYNQGMTDAQIDAEILKRQNEMKIPPSEIDMIVGSANALGIPTASHDDDNPDSIIEKKNSGYSISEFPVNMETARAAKSAGMNVVLGAPNLLLGRSHSGNLSAKDALREGLADILCSDYYPAAMLHSVFKMWEHGANTLPELIKMVTLNPAAAARIEEDFGSIEPGKTADIVFIDYLETGYPAVTRVLIEGREVLKTSYR